jgi:probable phosphoglycerate mutase
MVPKTAAGRMKDVHLNREGREQAILLAERLGGISFDRLCSSPLERAVETAEAIANTLNVEIQIHERLTEINCGSWTGRDFEDLQGDPLWNSFNTFRTGTRIPAGELILDVQHRMIAAFEELQESMPNGNIGIVSHGDPIKCVICYYAGLPLDFMLRFEISPASVSVLKVNPYGPRIFCINHVGELPSSDTW